MARGDPQINFRVPVDLRSKLDEAILLSGRTLTAEIVHRIEQSFAFDRLTETQAILVDGQKRLARMEAMIDSLIQSKR